MEVAISLLLVSLDALWATVMILGPWKLQCSFLGLGLMIVQTLWVFCISNRKYSVRLQLIPFLLYSPSAPGNTRQQSKEDDFGQIGIGPVLAMTLKRNGITSFKTLSLVPPSELAKLLPVGFPLTAGQIQTQASGLVPGRVFNVFPIGVGGS